MTQAINATRTTRISEWLKRKRWLLVYMLCFNLFLLVSGWAYFQLQHNPDTLALFSKIEPLFGMFTFVRIGLEIFIYFRWRSFIALLRRWFRLSIKFTWALLQYRIAFKFILYIELTMLVVRTIGKGGL